LRSASKLILCVCGMPGSGKTTAARAIESLGFGFVSMGDAVRRVARERGLGEDDSTLGFLMKELRATLGRAAVAKLTLSDGAFSKDRVVIDGVRNIEEVEEYGKIGRTVILAIHASPSVRFMLLTERKRPDVPPSWEEFVRRDLREIEVGAGAVIALAEEVVVNRGVGLEEFIESVKGAARRILEAEG